ncbi:MAG: hypothetical protein HYX54_08295 [Chloroflexi bacterium]|nr:hypothetical protein [Chloroflexota bacterium]
MARPPEPRRVRDQSRSPCSWAPRAITIGAKPDGPWATISALAAAASAEPANAVALISAVDRVELVDVLCQTWRYAVFLRGAGTHRRD